MPIETETRRWTYTGDGSSTDFAYEALAFEQSNLAVTVDGVTQVFSVDYTVTGLLSNEGGMIVFVSPPANGAAIEILRTVPPTQPVDLPPAGPLPADVIMRMVDRTVAAIIDRFGVVVDMRADAATTLASLLLPDPADGALLGWDGVSGALQNLVVNDGSVLPALLGDLTPAEITQLLNIDDTTISAAQWGFLGALTAAPAAADLSNVTPGSVTAALLGVNAVTTSKIAPGNIDLSKLANGLAGQVISYDGANAPVAVAAGTTGQVLTANSGAAPTFQSLAPGAPVPTGVPGPGEFRNVLTADAAAWTLPVSGTWAYAGFRVSVGGAIDTNVAGVAAGGVQVGIGAPSTRWRGFEWRVA